MAAAPGECVAAKASWRRRPAAAIVTPMNQMMRAMIVPLLLAASPAFATSTIQCTTPDRANLRFFLSVANAGPIGITQVRIVDAGRESVTGQGRGELRLTQNWIEPLDLRFEVGDSNVENSIARVVARRGVDRGPYRGTLRYRDRPMRISCLWDEDEG